MGERIDETALDTLFREARTYPTWQPRPVADQTALAPLNVEKTMTAPVQPWVS